MGLRRRPSLFFFAVAFVIHSLASLVAHGAETPAEVSSSLSRATRTPEGLEWTTRWILSPAAAGQAAHGPLVLLFAVALPPGERLVFGPGVEARVEDDRVTGLLVHPAALDGRTVRATFVQRVNGGAPLALGAPVATGTSTQIIDGVLGADLRLTVLPAPLLDKHVGYLSSRAISPSAREEARRLTGYRHRLSGNAVYVRGDDLRELGGLQGVVETPGDAAKGTVLAIAAAFAALVAALVFAARRLAHAASVERADALLVSEIERGAE
jgi:hypothetical protein